MQRQPSDAGEPLRLIPRQHNNQTDNNNNNNNNNNSDNSSQDNGSSGAENAEEDSIIGSVPESDITENNSSDGQE